MNSPKSLAVLGVIFLLCISQIPFGLAKWVAVGSAPSDSGEHQVIIKADYEGMVKTYVLELQVGTDAYDVGDLKVEPMLPISGEPPLKLTYDITYNGSHSFDMEYNSLVVYYISDKGEELIQSDNMSLIPNSDDTWSFDANVPLKGDYEAEIWIVVDYNGKTYGGKFITEFTATAPNADLMLDSSLSKRILTPNDKFEVYMTAIFEEAPLPELGIFHARTVGYDGIDGQLAWDDDDQRYEKRFDAPTEEGVYVIGVYAEDQDYLSKEKIYVADTSAGKTKSSRCPLSYEELGTCGDMADVRKCVIEYQDGDPLISEDALAACFESVMPNTYGSIYCNADTRGDFDGDNRLDNDDLQILQNLILPLDEIALEEYLDCADYDRDGDVDTDDLKCLTNVIGGKWFGDFQGGVCFDLEYDSPIMGDLNDDNFIKADDGLLMDDIVEVSENGIKLSAFDDLIAIADLTGDNEIDSQDRDCLDYFTGLDLTNPTTIPGFGDEIPSKCLVGYNIKTCQGVKGDINGDLIIDEVDELLINLVYKKVIADDSYPGPSEDRNCVDVNSDGITSSEDALCVSAYLKGDQDTYFRCLGCDENTPTEYRAIYEICNDGYDNDCDGYWDRDPHVHTICAEGYDDDCDGSSTATPNVELDYCKCNAATPCYLVEDADKGNSPGIDDGKVKVCRKVSWIPENNIADIGVDWTSSYQWMTPEDLVCDEDHQCDSMECRDTTYVCAYNLVKETDAFGEGRASYSKFPQWSWYDDPTKLFSESDDPREDPAFCDDGYDNDCVCGDRECEEVNWYDQFTTPEFLIAAVVGALLAILTGPGAMAMLMVSLGSAGGSIVAGAAGMTELSSALGGFGLGFAIGGMVAGWASSAGVMGEKATEEGTKQAVTTALEDAGEKGITEAGKKAIAEGAKEAAKKAAAEAGNQITGQALEKMGDEAVKQATKEAIEEAGKKAITKTAEEAFKESIKTASMSTWYGQSPLGEASPGWIGGSGGSAWGQLVTALNAGATATQGYVLVAATAGMAAIGANKWKDTDELWENHYDTDECPPEMAKEHTK